jgi:hypothetical protein
VGILLGLSHGPTGVALGYSAAMILIIIPIAAWSKKGTEITWQDLWRVTKFPLFAALPAAATGAAVKILLTGRLAPTLELTLGCALIFVVYVSALVAMGQKALYLDLLTQALRGRRSNP